MTAYQKVTRREYRRTPVLRKKKKIQKNVSTNNNYHKEKTITIKKKGVQRRIVSNNNRCPCPTKRTKRRVQLSTYLYICSATLDGDIICHRTGQNAEVGTETVTITCRETAIIFVSLCCVSRRIEAPTHLTETLLLLFFLLFLFLFFCVLPVFTVVFEGY